MRTPHFSESDEAALQARLEDWICLLYTSSAYADLLEKKLDKHAKIAGKAGTFIVREQDEALMREILKRKGFSQPVETAYLEFGGWRFMCPSEGFEIDETLDNALRNQKEWFQNNSGFTL